MKKNSQVNATNVRLVTIAGKTEEVMIDPDVSCSVYLIPVCEYVCILSTLPACKTVLRRG